MALLAYVHVSLGGTLRQIPAPVATFGAQAPAKYTGILVHAEPRTAFPSVTNAAALRGKIAVVQRGECSFAAKAKSLQAAGAIAMILTNSSEDLVRMGEAFAHEGVGIEIPVLMVGLGLGRSLRDGLTATVELKIEERSKASMDVVKKTVEQTTEVVQASVDVVKKRVEVMAKEVAPSEALPALLPSMLPEKRSPNQPLPPLFAFVLYATSADTYTVQFAPLADFGLSRKRLYYRGRLVFSHPLQAHTALSNKAGMPGSIVLVERGGCTFPEKIERAQSAGAIAVLVGNNDAANPDAAFVMSVDQLSADHITIPSVMLPYNVSQALQAASPDSIGIVCLEGEAAGVLLAASSTSISLWAPPPCTPSTLPPLVAAARENDAARVTELLSMQSPHACDAYNVTALHHACLVGAVDVVELLLAAGAQVDSVDLGSQTPLHYACMAPSVACVSALLTAAAHTLARNEGGSSPLHVACYAGSTECMELLLTASATLDSDGKYNFHGVDERDKSGRTPLHVACLHGHADCALYLMAAQAHVNLADARGFTPLHYVCDRLEKQPDMLHVIEQLLAYGAEMVDRTTSAAQQSLVLDRISDRRLRREVEVLYLRRQVSLQDKVTAALRSDLRSQAESYNAQLATVQATAEATATACQAQLAQQARQLDHVQRQLASVLQVLQTSGTPSVASTPQVVALPVTEHGDSLEETEKAQEAGLARDLGKKYLRLKQYATAVAYLDSSMALYKLPGVARLLQHATVLRDASSGASSMPPSTTQLVALYRERFAALGAPDHALEALESEVVALASMAPGSTEYDATKKWLDWLLLLPWTEASMPQSKAVFAHVSTLQADDTRRHAACVIQRAFRDRWALVFWRRDAAAVTLQAHVRGFLVRRARVASDTESSHSESEASEIVVDNNPTATDAPVPDTQVAKVDDIDVTSRVDSHLQRGRVKHGRVVRGVRMRHATKGDHACVLQWLTTDASNQAQHYIWCRWGASHAAESALKGPYDDDDAAREFERHFRAKTGLTWGCDKLSPSPEQATWLVEHGERRATA
ncbi:hypothetical protein, variant [Saprolegnia diclina VS20]|uniref:PA domain-containing protein n=1 Tax=Saprolegnia diclina (strain VS20) TaxID=1156394 RepID=T0Q635_SAPDV|nr:hypothetical protein, variant [Saprolegnia diclina VS20]EQC33329.1 hypothetical protein, variant [Saprolegnia diclina VS20]|eukprot:XP_008613452.1 hypothetical protein, variant [Saprolegnia diclina VS20]